MTLPSRSFFRQLLPSPADVLLGFFYLYSLTLPLETERLWWRLASGDWILAEGDVPRTNAFSFAAPDHPWINHEWLSDVLLSLSLDHLGPGWLLFVRSSLLVLTLSVLYHTLRQRGGLVPTLALVAISGLLVLPNVQPDPLLLSTFFLSLQLALLEDPVWRKGRALILLPLLYLFWANCHGSFLVGLGLFWLHVAGESVDRRQQRDTGCQGIHLVTALLCLPLSLCTPYYGALYSLGLEDLWQLLASIPVRLRLLELEFVTIASLGMLLSGLLIVFAGREIRYRLLLPLLALAPLAFLVPAYSPLFLVFNAVALMEHLQQLAERIQHERSGFLEELGSLSRFLREVAIRFRLLSQWDRRLTRGHYLALLLTLSIALFSIPPGEELEVAGIQLTGFTIDDLSPDSRDPRNAVQLLRTEPHAGRVMAPAEWGGYVAWAAYPILRPFIDSREDAYPLDLVDDYDLFASLGPGWEDVLERYQVDHLLWPADDFQVEALVTASQWIMRYNDGSVAVLSRTIPLPPPDIVPPDPPSSGVLEDQGGAPAPEPSPDNPAFGLFRENRSSP